MACDKKPLPGTPLRRDVIGMKLKWIASGIDGTVRSHSQCVFADKSPPLFEHITVIPYTKDQVRQCQQSSELNVSRLKVKN